MRLPNAKSSSSTSSDFGTGSNGRLHHPVYIREDVQDDLQSVVGETGTSLACTHLPRVDDVWPR
jgi:hypothetical protein